jgi:hypothetical protein
MASDDYKSARRLAREAELEALRDGRRLRAKRIEGKRRQDLDWKKDTE